MSSSLDSNKIDNSGERRGSESGRERDELKHVQQSVDTMHNRVQLLRMQLQKEKEAVRKHKQLTEEVVQRKVEFNKMAQLKTQESGRLQQEIGELRTRNHSYRQSHKQDMNNILKAVYLVKLDDARQIKNASLENRRAREQMDLTYEQQRRQRKRQMAEHSEMAKQKYMDYWKNKLVAVFNAEKEKEEFHEAQTHAKKQTLQQLQQEELQLLEEINHMHDKEMEAKKEYLAALSLSHRDVAEAANRDSPSKHKDKEDGVEMAYSKSESIRYKESQFYTKSPHNSLMSSSNINVPRANVDQNKFQIILKQLRRIDKTTSPAKQ